MPAKVSSSIASSQRGYLQYNWRKLKDLPAPGEDWIWNDTDVNQQLVKTLSAFGIIRVVGQRKAKYGNYVNVYRTNSTAYEKLQEYIENSPDGMLPCCDDAWIKNERGVDGITCGVCGEVHKREDL